jgi:Holliday junction DNA helicase RuvA
VIARVEGLLREKSATRVLVDVNGVGYELFIPLSTYTQLPDEGKTVALHVHTHVREDALQLYGFATSYEKAVFEMLLRASRIGPRLAQTILSGIAPEGLVDAIRDGAVRVLRGVPGVGPKMAERIIVELRDRVSELVGLPSASAGAGRAEDVREQVLSALLNLGVGRAQAERVIDGALEELGAEAALEALIRASLKRLV